MMRSSTYIALFAGSAAAQSSVSLFNLYPYAETLTQIGSDATATTYKNDCPASNAGISVIPSGMRPTPDSAAAAITPAPRARMARQADTMSSMTDGDDDYELCEPFTLKQGASTWEIHMTDPLPGAWTVDMNCKWQGAITNADLTCVATVDGFAVTDKALRGTTTTTLFKDELSTMELIGAVAVVTSSGAASASASASQTTSGAKSGAPAGSASKSSSGAASGAAGATPSTGFAPAGPLPTGVMALVGGAAGVFAAALAL